MSQNNNNKKPTVAQSTAKSWENLKGKRPVPKGPEKPWNKEISEYGDEVVKFLQDHRNKKALQEFVIDTFKRNEEETVERLKARMEFEAAEDESHRITPHHKPGNITPLMGEAFNMSDTEALFARGLAGTKRSLVRKLEERVEEVNRLLAGIGGFSANLKATFARSTVVFLEQEDPKYSFRELLIFSINLPNYELKRDLSRAGREDEKLLEDGRSPVQATWDDAVNALARIIESTGLKPKFCKNDRLYGRFVMKQDLRSGTNIPDEFFSFTLDYNTTQKIEEMKGPYNRIVRTYDKKIHVLEKKLSGYHSESKSSRYEALKKKHFKVVQERDFFVGTTPDPNQLEEGLLFLIEVSTLKDYHIVKDRMQSIMTKYILHLSSIASNEADFDPDLEYHIWKQGSNAQQPKMIKQGPKNGAAEDAEKNAKALKKPLQIDMRTGAAAALQEQDAANDETENGRYVVREYLVDESALIPFDRAKAAKSARQAREQDAHDAENARISQQRRKAPPASARAKMQKKKAA